MPVRTMSKMKGAYEKKPATGARKSLKCQRLTLTEQEGFRKDIGRQTPATKPGRQTPVVSALHLRVCESLITEQEGFEPPVPFGTTVFKTVALSRSATAPIPPTSACTIELDGKSSFLSSHYLKS